MFISINEAINGVLVFLHDISLSERTIEHYCWHYTVIKKYLPLIDFSISNNKQQPWQESRNEIFL